jgi:hypothetical protein
MRILEHMRLRIQKRQTSRNNGDLTSAAGLMLMDGSYSSLFTFSLRE